MPKKVSPKSAQPRPTRAKRPSMTPSEIKNPEKLKDPKYALALHIARMRRERGRGMPPGPMPPMR
jgi:hypothetical protein